MRSFQDSVIVYKFSKCLTIGMVTGGGVPVLWTCPAAC